MVTNDLIILNQVLQHRTDESDSSLPPSAFFEYFTAEQILKKFDLSDDEIESGLVGNGGRWRNRCDFPSCQWRTCSGRPRSQ